MAVKVRDIDNGHSALKTLVYGGVKPKLEVGIFPDGAGGQQYENGVTVYQAAAWAEEGTKTAPPRKWLSGWYDKNQQAVQLMMENEMRKAFTGEKTVENALAAVGRMCRASIQAGIFAKIPPPNAPATERKKGFDHPLIWTGKLLKAVAYRVLRLGR